MSELLRIEDLRVRYHTIEGLHRASLRVQAGQIVTVIGPNGAGKSTMLGAIMGLLPSQGRVHLQGEDISSCQVEERVKRGLALVPERRELFAEMPVENNLKLGSFSRTCSRAQLLRDLEEVYARFPRLHERRTQLAGTLSGGERQMLAIGRALMAKPQLVMLDEPSLGLSPLMVIEMFRTIEQLKADGVSVLLVEQNARSALNIADYGYVLETGEVVLEGPARELGDDPRIVQTYLGI